MKNIYHETRPIEDQQPCSFCGNNHFIKSKNANHREPIFYYYCTECYIIRGVLGDNRSQRMKKQEVKKRGRPRKSGFLQKEIDEYRAKQEALEPHLEYLEGEHD